MLVCTVVGHVWATKKEPSLDGLKFMLVRNDHAPRGDGADGVFVAADVVGAGMGERVLVVQGSTARIAARGNDVPVDAAIVGIIDAPEGDARE